MAEELMYVQCKIPREFHWILKKEAYKKGITLGELVARIVINFIKERKESYANQSEGQA